ncbi:transglutaminase family protein [Cellulophaga sp. Hel_I_12]|uniref:transglutaminase-like domain-containing protein n=1 Tax=Cellulophaga sp. Hel_I_12 TaxID=1249972 RepID=UPI0006465031|nr:transglutaminase family protein [Cellulophaga sp. Hel_I_12]
MPLEYNITYSTTNNYENIVEGAYWQFLIIPETNETQELVTINFENSLKATNQFSINGYGFQSIRVHPRTSFKSITFEASIFLVKKEVNPFDFDLPFAIDEDYLSINSLHFKVDFEPFLRKTHFTSIPENYKTIFQFDVTKSIFENLQNLNLWTYNHIYFKADVTDVNTTLDQIIMHRQGVCQDFTHLFCALARQNNIPARYVSGYLHQGNGYFGDSQMHAWAEAYLPNIGWVGFDPTNNLLVNSNHIKVCHGKDYNDCSPLKGGVYTTGKNETVYSVQVISQQQ